MISCILVVPVRHTFNSERDVSRGAINSLHGRLKGRIDKSSPDSVLFVSGKLIARYDPERVASCQSKLNNHVVEASTGCLWKEAATTLQVLAAPFERWRGANAVTTRAELDGLV